MELEDDREKLDKTGPFSVLWTAAAESTQVLVKIRNNHSLLGRVKAFDRHFNLLLEGVKEMWNELPRGGKGDLIPRERVHAKLFVRGDSVILVLKNPGYEGP